VLSPDAVDQYKVIDTDAHVIEPYDLWTSRISVKKWGDRVPHVKWDENLQEDAWFFGSERVGPAASAAQAGWSEYPPDHPPRLADVDPATWDPVKRLGWMDEHGVWAQVLYPNVAGFGAGKFLAVRDPELMIECVRAYNDFLTEYSATDTRRYIPIMAIPFWDLDATETEIKRCVELGHKGIIMSGEPGYWGLPKLGDSYWNRLWGIAQEAELSINFHIGSGDMSIFDSVTEDAGRHANYAGFSMQFGMSNAKVIAVLITSGVCHRYPRLNFVSVESGVGWLPFALEGMDWQWRNCGVPLEHPEYDLLPSEYFKRQIYGCFWFETDTARAAVDFLGPDCLLYETDFPHPTSMAPGPATSAISPRDFISSNLGDWSEEELQKILHGNAARIYHTD
jgi:predicted TIM-barrel fold metal-dependent hydrolase